MIEVIFLLVLAFVWIIFAVFSDIKRTEIPNWLNFSLIIFALGYRFFYALFSLGNFNFFYQGLIGLGIFAVVGNLLYYGRTFAGGDAKLMIALGAILPFSGNFFTNVKIFVSFVFLFLITGAIYGIFTSGYFAAKNFKEFKREFAKRYNIYLKRNLIIMIFALLVMSGGIFFNGLLLYLGALLFFLPLLYVYAKSVDESSMKKRINPKFLREGDWLYKDLKVGNKTIKANWDGLDKSDIKLLKKKVKLVTIRKGVVFAPVFLISFFILVYIYFFNLGLWNMFW